MSTLVLYLKYSNDSLVLNCAILEHHEYELQYNVLLKNHLCIKKYLVTSRSTLKPIFHTLVIQVLIKFIRDGTLKAHFTVVHIHGVPE